MIGREAKTEKNSCTGRQIRYAKCGPVKKEKAGRWPWGVFAAAERVSSIVFGI